MNLENFLTHLANGALAAQYIVQRKRAGCVPPAGGAGLFPADQDGCVGTRELDGGTQGVEQA